MSLKNLFCFASLLALAPAAPVLAADEGKGITVGEVVAILQDMGYRAKPDTDGEGDPSVATTMNGLNVFIYFYDCKQDRCGSLQMSLGLDMSNGSTLKAMNEFSKGFRYAHVFLDEEQDPFMQYDFEVLHTRHAEHVQSQVELFETLMEDFTRISGFDGDETPSDDEAEPAAEDAAQGKKPATDKLDL